jgi:hypothetical protein
LRGRDALDRVAPELDVETWLRAPALRARAKTARQRKR